MNACSLPQKWLVKHRSHEPTAILIADSDFPEDQVESKKSWLHTTPKPLWKESERLKKARAMEAIAVEEKELNLDDLAGEHDDLYALPEGTMDVEVLKFAWTEPIRSESSPIEMSMASANPSLLPKNAKKLNQEMTSDILATAWSTHSVIPLGQQTQGSSKSDNLNSRSTSKDQIILYGIRTTAYNHLESDHLSYSNKSAQGTPLKFGTIRSAAADWSRFPVGTRFRILGIGDVIYEVDDYGSALTGSDTIDLYKPSLDQMNQWGVRHVDIEILEWGSYAKSAEIMRGREKYWHIRDMLSRIVYQPGKKRR